eukprot:365734-Chlamydomonas_euryale.AAC.22
MRACGRHPPSRSAGRRSCLQLCLGDGFDKILPCNAPQGVSLGWASRDGSFVVRVLRTTNGGHTTVLEVGNAAMLRSPSISWRWVAGANPPLPRRFAPNPPTVPAPADTCKTRRGAAGDSDGGRLPHAMNSAPRCGAAAPAAARVRRNAVMRLRKRIAALSWQISKQHRRICECQLS